MLGIGPVGSATVFQYWLGFCGFNTSDPQENVAHLECHIQQVGSYVCFKCQQIPLLRGRINAGKCGI